MITNFDSYIYTGNQEVTPDWIRSERYMYCDQFFDKTNNFRKTSRIGQIFHTMLTSVIGR